MPQDKEPKEPDDFKGVRSQFLRFCLYWTREAQPFLVEGAKNRGRFSWAWALAKGAGFLVVGLVLLARGV